MLTVSLLGRLHCVTELVVLVGLLHLAVYIHHVHVPLLQGGGELTLATHCGAIGVVLACYSIVLAFCSIVLTGSHFCFYIIFGKKLRCRLGSIRTLNQAI